MSQFCHDCTEKRFISAGCVGGSSRDQASVPYRDKDRRQGRPHPRALARSLETLNRRVLFDPSLTCEGI